MSLYLCVFDGDREADGVEVGPYADFNALRMAVAATAPGGAAASTFPTLLGHSDCDGAWSPEDCARLRAELETAETSLRARPPAPFPSPWQAEAARAVEMILELGQDVFAQFATGLRLAFIVGALGGGIASVVGMLVGFTAGYRSGIVDYLNAARKLADRFWECPEVDRGQSYVLDPNVLTVWPWRSTSTMGLVLRALDGRPDMWAGPSATDGASGLHHIWNHFMSYLTGYDATHGIYDTREVAYHLKMTAYCALFDTSSVYQKNCQNTIANSFPAIWTPSKFADGSWPQIFHDQSTPGSWGLGGVTLTHGSAAVTALGSPGWSAGQFPSRIWFLNSLGWPANNSATVRICSLGYWLSKADL